MHHRNHLGGVIMKAPKPLLMTEEYWRNSHLSIARHYGSISFNGFTYIIVDKMGRDLFECSHIANKEGRSKAIEPGEPADLIWDKLQKDYKRLGRDTIMRLLEEGKGYDEIHKYKED